MQKYEVGSLNPIVEFLREKPYEHRVAGLPFRSPEQLALFDQVYRIEWMQHHFPYYNIQCLDKIQMPRMPADLVAYETALAFRGTPESVYLLTRLWELTNTRYLLGPAGFLETMNGQLDPEQHRFRIVKAFDIVSKPGIARPEKLEELTAVPNDNGAYALFEFTGALPRAKLYSTWQVNTNDEATLQALASTNFDAEKLVLVASSLPVAASTNENPGTVEFKSYTPKHIVFTAQANAPSILLLNDKYDSNWRVTVDGQPAELLRCNFIMRGVYLAPSPNPHTVEFQFSLTNKPLYVTLSAIGVGILLSGFLIYSGRCQRPVK